MARLTEAGLPLEAGELDVRPETLADADAVALAALAQARAAGLRIALDDCSDVGELERACAGATLDRVKLHPRLTRNAEADAGAAASVQALVAWAGARGMTVAAKAVETAAQAQRMARLGCHAAQGHHFGRPEVV
jgi:EAL domain-containing protein (putative c-di-GMP-specific phosphodiesterase class I)